MNDRNSAGSKDQWWRDFWMYGSATHLIALPILLVPLFTMAWLIPSCRAARSRPVILYCAQDQVFAEPLLAAFTRETGIRVKAVFDSEAVKTVGLANRLLAEQANPVADIFWGNEELRTRQLAHRGVFRASNGWAAFGQRSRRLVINTNEPDGFPVPASLIELTNARYRGRISLAFPLFGTTATHFLSLRPHWGESNWLVWCRALAANAPFIEEGNSHVVKRVARGEAWVGLTDSDDITSAQHEGLPLTALPPGPDSLLIPNTVALVAKAGETPSSVRRLFDFLQSGEVREKLITAGALETNAATAVTLRPDWKRVLAEMEVATGQLKQLFQR